MQGNPSLNGHSAQIQQYLTTYVTTEQWSTDALTFLAQFRDDVSSWELVLQQAGAARIFPLELEKRVDEWRVTQQPSHHKFGSTPLPSLMQLSTVEPQDVNWLWEPYIPLGKLTLLEGDPAVGKTWLSLAIGAAITRGIALPGLPGERRSEQGPRTVVFMQGEDGFADTIRPRFDVVGGDPERLWLLTGKQLTKRDDEEPITLQDLPTIEMVLIEHGPALLIIDPLQAYLGAKVDMNRSNHTRPLLAALGRLAEAYQCAVICIRHLSKAAQSQALYRGLGSIDFSAAARSVLLAGFDPDDPNRQRRVLGHSKSSLAMEGPSLGYELRDGRFKWLGVSDITVAQLLAQGQDDEKRSELDEAIDFLTELLSPGMQAAKDVRKEAKSQGISLITLKRAKKRLDVKSWREGLGINGRGHGQWVWGL